MGCSAMRLSSIPAYPPMYLGMHLLQADLRKRRASGQDGMANMHGNMAKHKRVDAAGNHYAPTPPSWHPMLPIITFNLAFLRVRTKLVEPLRVLVHDEPTLVGQLSPRAPRPCSDSSGDCA
jgi:hypothetical protein